MKFLNDCVDSIIRAIQIFSQSIAFLLGIHLVVVWHFIRFLAFEPIRPTRTQDRSRGSRRRNLALTTVRWRQGEATTRRGIILSSARFSSPPRVLHLPALEPRPYEEREERKTANYCLHLGAKILRMTGRVRDEVLDLADQAESRGGKTGELITLFRKRGEEEVNPALLQKLPPEIVNDILLVASESIPTKICLLSKMHYRLVTSRLYSAVELCDPKTFHQFRMTMALHNPNLGRQIRSLSVGSCHFDSYGYLPEGIAESAALGVGLEQILLAASHLKHLYLDLFSLAALHDGTGSRLQKGSSLISLSTEYAAPQYLSIPVFSNLQHVELSVFGLDKMSAEHLRQALPRVKSLTLRWVTRQSEGFDDVEGLTDFESESMENGNERDGSQQTWSSNNYLQDDFNSFVEALETLRLPSSEEISGRQCLDAITVLAWPNMMRQLSHYYRQDKDIHLIDFDQYVMQQNDPAWDKSMGQQDNHFHRPRFDRPARRQSVTIKQVIATPSLLQTSTESRTPLRLATDPTFRLGPRRGPLEGWSSRWS